MGFGDGEPADDTGSADFESWAAQHWHHLLAIARVVTGDPTLADDVLQDALVDIYRRWDRIGGDGNRLAYATRVMGSKVANQRRTAWARRVRTTDDTSTLGAASPALVTGDHASGLIDQLTVAHALAQLNPRQRQIVAMHYLLDMPVAEIAAELGRPVGSVTSDLTRARQRLRADAATSDRDLPSGGEDV